MRTYMYILIFFLFVSPDMCIIPVPCISACIRVQIKISHAYVVTIVCKCEEKLSSESRRCLVKVYTPRLLMSSLFMSERKRLKKKVKKKEWEERKNVSAVVHARTHARTDVFPACIDERSNRRSQLATRVDRCETGSDELTLAEFANLFRRSFRFAIIVRICVSLIEIYWKIMINYLICI